MDIHGNQYLPFDLNSYTSLPGANAIVDLSIQHPQICSPYVLVLNVSFGVALILQCLLQSLNVLFDTKTAGVQ